MNGKIHVEIIDLPTQNITVKGTLTFQAQATSLHKGEWFESISNVLKGNRFHVSIFSPVDLCK